MIVPLSTIVSSLVKFLVQFVLFIGVLLYYYYFTDSKIQPNIYILLTPLLLFLMAMQGLGFGIIISSLTTKYRDFRFIVGFAITLWMYATPVIYPLSSMPEKYKFWILANPMTSIIETFRFSYLGVGSFSWINLIYCTIFTVILFLVGTFYFNVIERKFMDTV